MAPFLQPCSGQLLDSSKEKRKYDQHGRHICMGAGVGVAHSAAAKAGVLSLTRTLAVEWGKQYRIRVNAIAPGPIERTGGADKLWESEEAAQRTLDSVPLGRLGTPEEIAELASFLLSEHASYMNGDCITMDGGQWLNQSPF